MTHDSHSPPGPDKFGGFVTEPDPSLFSRRHLPWWRVWQRFRRWFYWRFDR